jgi:hypothetical protein
MLTIGVDPGSPVTIGALLDGVPLNVHDGEAVAVQLVKTGRKTASWVNQAALITTILRNYRKDYDNMMVIIERVWMRPNESLSAGIPFVGSMFLTEGICAGLRIPYRLVNTFRLEASDENKSILTESERASTATSARRMA